MKGGRVAGVFGAMVAAWLAGFAWFVLDATRVAMPPPQADGIVALTGGAERVATALRLLRQGSGRMLLISGVGRGASLPSLARDTGIDTAALSGMITLGRRATTTIGNAAETAAWANQNGLRRLIVVTAGYHMPRALIEIGRDLPEATLYPAPVVPPALRQNRFSALRLMAGEYAKFLVAELGLTRLGHARDAG
jgi:uncharacterized SAM-binding protein YcdF (DUF218 family)